MKKFIVTCLSVIVLVVVLQVSAFSQTSEIQNETIYRVVVNNENQYSIWPVNKDRPIGWNDAGKIGSRQECLEYIQRIWTNMEGYYK